ncbi:MAG: hypothetical protein PHS12_05905, partial [Candidatus Omnitrophica bacterium]|nr:hypothetical protein [Candidatus Omnitrophota bacterium]
ALTKRLILEGATPEVIGTVSGSVSAQNFWQGLLNSTRESFKAKAALSFHEDLPTNQAFGILLLWQRLREKIERDHSSLIAFVFGDGTRSTPFTETDCAQKPAINTFVNVPAGEGKVRYLSMVELAMMYFIPVQQYLRRSGFAGLVLKWGDEVQIPTRSLSGADELFRDADIVRFVSIREMTDDEARNKDWVGVNANRQITIFIPRRPLSEMEELADKGLLERRDGRLFGGVNLGSVAISYVLLDALLNEFGADVNDTGARRKDRPALDPEFFTALCIALIDDETERNKSWQESINSSKDVKKMSEKMPDILERLRKVAVGFKKANGRAIKMVAMDFVDQYWGDVGQHKKIYEFYMALNANTPDGEISRSIAGIPDSRDKNGNIIVGDSFVSPEVEVRNSVLINTVITGKGKVWDSVLINTRVRDIEVEKGYDFGSVTSRLTIKEYGGTYKCIYAEPVYAGEKERVTALFLPGREVQLYRVMEDTELKDKDNYDKPILGNPTSFRQAHEDMGKMTIQELEMVRESVANKNDDCEAIKQINKDGGKEPLEIIKGKVRALGLDKNVRLEDLKVIEEHERDVCESVKLLLSNRKAEFCRYEAKGRELISGETFAEYFNRIDEIENSALILRITMFSHDTGKRVKGAPHPESSYEKAKEILQDISLPPEAKETILWLIRYHDVSGNISTGERKASFLLEEMLGLGKDKQKQRLSLLQAVTLCDMRGSIRGDFLTDKKARFYLELSDPDNLKRIDNELFGIRMKVWSGSVKGEDNRPKENALRDKIEKSPYRDHIKEIFGRKISHVIYGVFLFIALDAEELARLMEEIAKASKKIMLAESNITLEFTKGYREGQKDSEIMLEKFKPVLKNNELSKFIEIEGNKIIVDNAKMLIDVEKDGGDESPKDNLKQPFTKEKVLDQEGLRDKLPLDFVDLSSEEVRETELPGWPKYEEYGNKELSIETKIFLALPSLTGSFYGDVGYDVQIAYSLAYLRQLKPEERRKVLEQLSELGYIELSAWCSDSYDLGIEERADAIERSYPGDVEVNRNKLLSFVEERDRIAGRSRALRVAVEALEAQAPGPEYRAAAYRIIENKAIREVFFGLRAAVVTELAFSEEELETIREVLWGQRQVRVDGQGGIFNIMKLDEGKYYIYEEYILKRIARDKGDGYIVAPYSREGLEAMIRQDMSRRRGEYYDITSNTEHRDGEGRVRPAERLSRNILAGVKEESFSEWKAEEYAYHAGKLAPRVFTVDVPAVDVNTTATINREAALRKQLTAELETETIFNNRIPQIIIDDSEPGILAQNRKNTRELGEKYGVQIIHLTAADRERDQRAIALRLKDIYAKELAEDSLSGSVKAVFRNNGILKENGIDEEGLIKYVNANVFHHISGVRNYTLLKVKELWEKGIFKRARTVMSMDDDAPPETYLLKRRAGNAVYKDVPGYNREQIIKERLARREKYVEDMLKEASRMIGGRVSDEAEFFALLGDSDNYDKLCGLV